MFGNEFSFPYCNYHIPVLNVVAPKVDVTIEQPGVQETSMWLADEGTETFDSLSKTEHLMYTSRLGGTMATFRNFNVLKPTDNCE